MSPKSSSSVNNNLQKEDSDGFDCSPLVSNTEDKPKSTFRLPVSFSIFRSIQFANLKHSEISLTTFLTDIENELRRQNEIQTTSATQATALSVTPQTKHKTLNGPRPPRQRFVQFPTLSHQIHPRRLFGLTFLLWRWIHL
ncbi:hypothetical protein VP01_1102g2 [Puccinia sorghi]|uniref:Uncharacterized protein n=1 Tax=Puccinia sorghi TaxID=27349 RepID=A0A0L6VSS4_9BASI|nr:hypothetical protein VP01_1102g2 [Puccinia sorghi]